ncbi:MAG: hypothetical protein RR364_01615 [Lachnospiraceae bacterium]
MLAGVYLAKKKDGTTYYRSNITYHQKHISLGSFFTEEEASQAYFDAKKIVSDTSITIENFTALSFQLSHDKIISLLNFRDNALYFKTPIYLRRNFFQYFISEQDELKFDRDDLFYYASHKIMRRQGHLFVSDYGMQVTILSRYGILNYGVENKDYRFVNGDSTDFRYSNIQILNSYFGVTKISKKGNTFYNVKIHINGNYLIGTYRDEITAAIAYNKAVDLAKAAGIQKNYSINYIPDYSSKKYAETYTNIKLSTHYLNYLASLNS